VLESVGASGMLVSGQGLREGIALSLFSDELPGAAEVREAAVEALAARFSSWDARLADHRVRATEMLIQGLDPDLEPDMRESLVHAARLLDIGRSVDFYNRHEHTTSIVLDSDLSGFSHRAAAVLAAITRLAGKDGASLKALSPIVGSADQATLARAAAILDLSDSIVRQWPPDSDAAPGCQRDGAALRLHADWLHPWPLQAAVRRVAQIFAVQVSVTNGSVVERA